MNTVPGVLHCARCKFRLQRMVMIASTGAVGVDPNTRTEPCPNGCGPLWPVTWEQEASERGERLEHFFDRAIAAEKALRELVALKTIRDDLDKTPPANWSNEQAAQSMDYFRRKPAAWAAAIAVVDANPGAQT